MTPLRLLNVEDVEADTELVVLQLERSGYQVEYSRVETAEQMREMLRSDKWDVIISDYSLPAFSGLDAFQILKDSGLDIPFIMISGTIGEESAVAAMKAGVSDYLMKDNLGKIGPTIARELGDAEVRRAKRLAEGALAESEEDFRGLVLATTQHVWEMDAKGKHARLPQWWFDLTGQSIDEAADLGWLACVHPEDRDQVKHTFLHALESQTQASLQFRIKNAAGTYRYLAARGVPLRRQDGTFRKWICTLADISEQMQAVDELRRSEERFRGLVEASSQFVWTADADGRDDELFKWLSELCRCEVHSFADIEKVIHEADLSTVWPMWTDALRDQKPYQFICRLQDKKQGYRHFEFRGNPIYNDTGTFREWVGTIGDVTDKFAALEALERSEIHLRTIVDGSPECIKLLSRDIRILEMNRTGLDLMEAESLDELVGREAIEFVVPECRNDFKAIVQQVFQGGNGRLEYEMVSLKGTRRWFEMHAAPLRDRSGEIQSLLGLSRDVTKRRKTSEALKKSEARFRELFENANDLVYTHDLDGRFTSLNRAGEAITGYTREEALKLSIEDVVAPEFIALGKEKMDEKFEGNSATSYETEIIRKDGRRVTLDLSTRLIYEEGVAVGVQGIARDITDRILAREALRKSEQQLRVVTDTVPAVITYVDKDHICRFANRTYCEWLGKSREEVIGHHMRDVQPSETYEMILPEIEAALRGERLTLERPSHVKDSRDATDEISYLRLDYVPDIDEKGEVIGYFAFAVDLSETRRAQEALRKSEEQLMQAQKLDSIGRLAGGIAHDFNNMLTAITGYSDLALRRMKADEPLRHHIEEIMKAGKRSAELTNQLLAFSRRQMLQPQIIDVNDIIADTLVMLRRLIGEHIELSVQLGDDLSPVSVDPGQLSQILVNLIINSRDAMPDGGSILIETANRTFDVPFTSEHHSTPPGEYVMIAVSDNGFGMDEETKTHMFEPFFTTKEVGKGTGLGLSTVYGVVKQSGGSIYVYTEPKHGTTIKIYLPRVESAANVEIVVTPPNELRFGTETILLVEDEDVVRNLSREVLQSCGYTVIEAANGVEALEVFKRAPRRIDMVMTDVVMPQMGGSDLAKKILELQPDIKILFTSGYTDSAAVRHGVLEKGSSFLAKPFTFGQLASKLKEIFTSE